uniref:Outer dense fiber protein 3 n=1 Tax=Glossina brevipalpis TaxID=37001 RepID=A0A1A9W895_9MUSC
MAKETPGPADLYGLPPTVGHENHDVRKQRLPKYSFGVKTEQKILDVGPGPARYNVEKLVRYGVSKANHFTIAPKTNIIDKVKSPGPQAYAVHIFPIFKGSRAPAYSMGKVNTFEFKKCAPGPNKYGIKDTFIRQRAPAYTLGVKKYLAELVRSPGPAGYPAANLNRVKSESPKYTLTPNNVFVRKLYGPGSNYYNRMNYKPGKKSPIYSFGIRHHSKTGSEIKAKRNRSSNFSIIVPPSGKPRSPGPAGYGASNISLTKRSSPQFSIAPRIGTRWNKSWVPASNHYNCMNYQPGKKAPSYSFGRRISTRSPSLIIPD